jgi:hypothetical protein
LSRPDFDGRQDFAHSGRGVKFVLQYQRGRFSIDASAARVSLRRARRAARLPPGRTPDPLFGANAGEILVPEA